DIVRRRGPQLIDRHGLRTFAACPSALTRIDRRTANPRQHEHVAGLRIARNDMRLAHEFRIYRPERCAVFERRPRAILRRDIDLAGILRAGTENLGVERLSVLIDEPDRTAIAVGQPRWILGARIVDRGAYEVSFAVHRPGREDVFRRDLV